MTLRDLERLIKERWPHTKKKESPLVHLVTHADDFIITGSSKELLENDIKPAIQAFLKERGLGLVRSMNGMEAVSLHFLHV